MKVCFIHHSSFAVELEDKILVFDYFDKNRVTSVAFTGHLPAMDPQKTIYFFASHKHADHFDMGIFRFLQQYPKVEYLLSKDTKMTKKFLLRHGFDPKQLEDHIHYLQSNKDYQFQDMKVHTLRSTDTGVAFVVSCNGKNIYHAGDLHWWKWEGAGELINGRVGRDYKFQLRYLEKIHLNLAFVVLDPRLQEHAFLGLDYFMNHVNCDYVFPMHMWQDYEIINRWKKRSDNSMLTERLVDITAENQTFLLEHGALRTETEIASDIQISVQER